MNKFFNITGSALLFTTLCLPALASEKEHDHGHDEKHEEHEQDAHVHGIAELTLILEDNELVIEFESPAMNILGFEHEASTPEQKNAVKAANETLAKANELFSFSGTSCVSEHSDINLAGVMGKDEHEGHGDEHEEHGDEEEFHSDIVAEYHYECTSGSTLQAIDVNLLDIFPGIEKLQSQWVINGQQGAQTLTPAQHTVSF